MPKSKDQDEYIVSKLPEGFASRAFTPASYDEKARCVRATVWSEDPVRVYDGATDQIIMEVLRADGCQLPTRGQLPLLDNHNRWNGSGSVRGSVRDLVQQADGSMQGNVYFSSTAEPENTLAREGHLTDLSTGYQTFNRTEGTVWIPDGQRATVNGKEYINNHGMPMAIRTMWKPFEISTTPIGADERCSFRESSTIKKGERNMPEEKKPVETPAQAPAPESIDVVAIRTAAAKEAGEAERGRILNIRSAAGELKIPDTFYDPLITSGVTETEAIRKMTVEAQRLMRVAPVQKPDIQSGKDETENRREGMLNGILLRTNYPFENAETRKKISADVAKSDFNGMTGPQALAKKCLENAGVRGATYMDNVEVAKQILSLSSRAVAQGTGDFPYILAAAANKFLMLGYNEQNVTWDKWVGRQPLNDFKQNKLVNISLFSDVDLVKEGESFSWGKQADKGEYATLYKYGKAFLLSYEAIVNDDKYAFSRIPRNMAGAMNRKQNRTTYDYLYGATGVGPAMNEDSLYMFDATATTGHANLLTGAVPSIAALNLMRKALRKIKLPAPDKTSKTQYSNAPIKYIITGTTYETSLQQLLMSPGDPALTNAAIINPFQGSFTPVIDPVLDEYDTNAAPLWYVATDPNIVQHIAMFTLAGEEAPQLRSEPSEIGMARGIAWELMFSFCVAAEDWRGMVKNPGH